MLETLTQIFDQAGPFAPLAYIALYVVSALLPFIPTPLISGLGGKFLGFQAAVGYGVIGLAIGAFVALTLARRLGRPLVLRLVGQNNWNDWESFLGVGKPLTWGIVFAILNVDFVVIISGLSSIHVWKLWLTAIIARLPWVLLSASLGEKVLDGSGASMIVMLIIFLFVIMLLLRFAGPLLRVHLSRHATTSKEQSK